MKIGGFKFNAIVHIRVCPLIRPSVVRAIQNRLTNRGRIGIGLQRGKLKRKQSENGRKRFALF